MITIHYNKLRTFTLCLLLLPAVIFLLTWVKIYLALPAVALLGLALNPSIKTEDKTIKFRASQLVVIGVVISIWLFLSGMGGFFTQKLDLLYRNAIYRDLINFSWPVRYQTQADESLVYYIGHWLFPALIGKLVKAIAGFNAGWLAARIALFVYTFVFIYTSILLILFRINKTTWKAIGVVVSIFVLFSGMDFIGELLTGGTSFHLDLWATYFQYSSMATQLNWVFNQAVPAWLACSLMLNEKDEKSFALIGLSLLPTSPLPLVGLAAYMLVKALASLVKSSKAGNGKETLANIFSRTNILSAVALVPFFYAYYSENVASDNSLNLFADWGETDIGLYFFFYVLFILLEVVIIPLLIFKDKNKLELTFVVITLLIFPFIRLGQGMDFCMRASIPSLFILMVLVMEYILDALDKPWGELEVINKIKLIALIICLMIGVLTPIDEYKSSINHYIETNGACVKECDYYETLIDLPLDRSNFVGEDASNSIFFGTLAR